MPDDVIAVKIQSIARTPRRLYLNPIPGSDLLKIDDPPGGDRRSTACPASGQPRRPDRRLGEVLHRPRQVRREPGRQGRVLPPRGFFSCYPVKDVKPGAQVLAEFAVHRGPRREDVCARGWSPTTRRPRGGPCFMGSGEIYRMYAHDKEYYERFWGKLHEVHGRQAEREGGPRPRARQQGVHLRHAHPRAGPGPEPDLEAVPHDGPGAIDPSSASATSGTGEREDSPGPFPMIAKPSPGGFDGYYPGRSPADPSSSRPATPSTSVVIDVPDSPGETLPAKFAILKSDPETGQHPAGLRGDAGDGERLRRRLPGRIPAG